MYMHIQKRHNATTAQPGTEGFPQTPKTTNIPQCPTMGEYINVHHLNLIFGDSETTEMKTKQIIGLDLTNNRFHLLSIDYLLRALPAMVGYCFVQTWMIILSTLL